MAGWLEQNGLPLELQRTEEGLTNLVASVSGKAAGPHLLLLGHADTVEPAQGWTRQPFEGELEGDRLYGVGAMDMKGGLVAAMLALRQLARNRDWSGTVTFASVADEENSSRGMKAFMKKARGFDAAIVCEPHFDDVVIGAVGKFNLRLTCRGRSAHGSRPKEGVNAIDELARLLTSLNAVPFSHHELIGEGTRCVLNFTGGPKEYQIQVPDHASCLINWHLVPGETTATAVQLVEELITDLNSQAGFTIEVLEPTYPSYLTNLDDPFIQRFRDTYEQLLNRLPALSYGQGVSDANYLAAAGIPTVMFGPSGANMHAPDEWSDTPQITRAAELYETLVRNGQQQRRQ